MARKKVKKDNEVTRENEIVPTKDPTEPEIKPEPVPEPKPQPIATPVAPPKPVVPLAVFLKVAGPKWDQLAGFRYYAKKNELGPMSVNEWREALKLFMKRPTR